MNVMHGDMIMIIWYSEETSLPPTTPGQVTGSIMDSGSICKVWKLETHIFHSFVLGLYQNQAQYTKETKGSILDSKIKPQSRFKPISGPLWEKYFCLTIHPVILMFLIYYDTIQTNLVIGELPRCFNATNYIALQFKYFARVEQFRLTLIPKWIQDIDNECLEDWEKVCVLLKAISSVFYWC